MRWLWMVFVLMRSLFRDRCELAIENLALRQQLAVFQGKKKRPRIRQLDRILWVWLSRLWSKWRSVLVIVKPDTVIRWHQQGFRLYWRWKSRPKTAGRPPMEVEIRKLIRRMCRENPTWGAPRIHSELQLLGYDVSETTVDKYMIRSRKPVPPENLIGPKTAFPAFPVLFGNCSHRIQWFRRRRLRIGFNQRCGVGIRQVSIWHLLRDNRIGACILPRFGGLRTYNRPG